MRAGVVAVLVGLFPASTRGDGGVILPPPNPGVNGVPGIRYPTVPTGKVRPPNWGLINLALSLEGSGGSGSAWPTGTPVPTRGREAGWSFMPAIPSDVLTLALLTCTNQRAAPYLSPEFIAAAALIEIGEPALVALSASRGLGPSESMAKYVENAVRPLPDRPVAPVPAAPPAEAMLRRLVLEDLSAGYIHAQGAPFAPRLTADRSILLGALPRLIEAAKNAHPLIRRNAVHLIGALRTEPVAEEELCRILESSDDAVCRARALRALLSAPCPRAGAILRKQITSSREDYFRHHALYALGFVDPQGSRDTAIAVLRARTRDDDESVWAALQCLFAGAPLDAPSRDEVKRLEASLAAAEGPEERIADLAPTLKPYRACVLRRMAWCTLAMGGEAGYRERILQALDPGRHRRVLAGFPGPTSLMALQVLASAHPGAVWKVVQDEREEAELRSRAIALLGKPDSGQAEILREMAASPKVRPLVRLAAMEKLAETDLEGSAGAARGLLEAYVANPGRAEDATAEWVALAAARQLADRKAAEVPLLLRALERALKDRGAAPPRPAVHVPLVEGLIGLLASAGGAEAAEALRKLMKSGKGAVAGEAALALGESGAPGVEADLLEGLEAPDGWVRFCSYHSLRRLAKRESPCDWIYSAAEARRPSVKAWKGWVAPKVP